MKVYVLFNKEVTVLEVFKKKKAAMKFLPHDKKWMLTADDEWANDNLFIVKKHL